MEGGNAMVSHLFFSQLVLLGLLWLCCLLHAAWPSSHAAGVPRPPERIPPSRKRPRVPKPFPGLTRAPHCAACAQAAVPRPQAPCAPPPRIVSTRGRPRQVDTSRHFCPAPDCMYSGWLGLGNITSNGHPSGGPWRQLHCSSCGGYFQETHGTPLHGTHVAPEKLVWAVGALAEGLGTPAFRDRKSTRLNSSHTVIYTLSLHDALPIFPGDPRHPVAWHARGTRKAGVGSGRAGRRAGHTSFSRSEEHTSELQSHSDLHSFPTRRSSDLSRRPTAPRCMARTWHPKSWCGQWARWQKGWAHQLF